MLSRSQKLLSKTNKVSRALSTQKTASKCVIIAAGQTYQFAIYILAEASKNEVSSRHIDFRMMTKKMMMCTSQAWARQRFVPSGLSSHGAWHTSFSSESSSGSLFLSVSDTTWSTSKTSKLKPAFSAH